MKILILGVKGNLGAQLATVFSETEEAEIVGWDRDEVDITDGAALQKKIVSLKPEIIINAAAYNAVDKCETDEKEFALARKINGEAVGFLAQAAEKVGATLVHYSTDYVFSGKVTSGYDETAVPEPINNYGRSKLAGEQQILNSSLPQYYLIRTSKLFGPVGPSAAAKPSFFDLMLKASQTKTEIKVVDEEKSCFTYTPDLARATKKLIDEKKPFGIYHIFNSEPTTWYEACLKLYKLARIKTKVLPVSGQEFPRPAQRPANSTLLNTKLPPLRSFREALREYLQR